MSEMSGNGSMDPLDRIAALGVAVLPRPDEVADARNDLFAAIRQEREAAATRPRRRFAVPALAGALVAAVIAIAVVVTVRPPAAVAVLENLAVVAERQPDLELSEGSYVLASSTQTALNEVDLGDSSMAFLLPEIRDVWVAPDGSRIVRRTIEEPIFFDPADAARFEAAGLTEELGIGEVITDRFGPLDDGLDPSLFPLDPTVLDATLRELVADDPRGTGPAIVELAGDLLVETDAEPELRAALIRVLARTESVDVVRTEDVIDVAAVFDVDGRRVQTSLRFDADTSALVLRREVALDGFPDSGIPPGTSIIETRFSAPQIVTTFGP